MLDGDEASQRLGHVRPALEALGDRAERVHQLPVARQVEPRDAAAARLVLRRGARRPTHATPRPRASPSERAASPRVTASSIRTRSCHGTALQGGAIAGASAESAAWRRYTSTTGVSRITWR